MLTQADKEFISYWEKKRIRQKKSIWQFSVGLPLGALIVLALFINIASGWYKRADMELRSNSSLIIVILIASIAIVIFISIFSAKYKWEQNEQHYRELLAKQDSADTNTTT